MEKDDNTVSIINDDGQVVKLQLPFIMTRAPEYPSDWFRSNPGKRPPVVIPKTIVDKEIWSRMLGSALESNVISKNLAVRLIYDHTIANYSDRLSDDWNSFGIVIGRRGSLVNPFSCLQVTTDTTDWTGPETAEIDDVGMTRLYIILLAAYRYGQAAENTQGDYKSVVLSEVNQVVRKRPFNLKSNITPTELSSYRYWYTDPEYRALVAALDMYWNKFPDSCGAKLRVCTLTSRYKDCSLITEMKHLTELSSRKQEEIVKYIFSPRVIKELPVISRPGEEVDKEDSYFPYFRELRLSKKSPYSATQNPNLHHWVSIFCALLGSKRSFNAKIVKEVGMLSWYFDQAIFAAYAFTDAATARVTDGTDGDRSTASVPAIDPTSPLGVYRHMQSCKNEVPPEIMQEFARRINRMGTPRPNTIGSYLKRNLSA